ncbi:DedA family protein [Candidatus Gracilibacteria bacterium]|nr:DedA family protein [Candidatus Gracilibacteria bacterium]
MFDIVELIKTVGYIGVTAIVFAESGLLIGFFLPGDSLLFTAGLLASQGYLNIYLLVPLCFAAAVFGDSVGYAFGKKMGPKIFNKKESRWFHPNHLERANAFFEKYGGKAIILARFMPVVRTFTPIVAGAGNMTYRKFVFNNVLGGFLWTFGLTLAGYFLGKSIPDIDRYLLPIIGGIILLSILPVVFHFIKERKKTS